MFLPFGIKKISKGAMWTIAVIVNIVVGLGLLASAYGGMVDPNDSAIFALLAMTFPGWVVLELALLVINLIFFRKIGYANLLLLIACMGPMLTYSPITLFTEQVTDQTRDRSFTLLTYNVYGFNYYDTTFTQKEINHTLSIILKADADVVCLQEAGYVHPHGEWHFDRQQWDSLRQTYPYMLCKRKLRLVTLSKYPLDSIPLDNGPMSDSRSSDVLACRLHIAGENLTILNTHFHSIPLTTDDKDLFLRLTDNELGVDDMDDVKQSLIDKLTGAYRARAREADYLAQYVARSRENIIIAGDFNDIPGSYVTRALESAGMHDAYFEKGNGPSFTYFNNRFYFRIDHIFYRGRLKPMNIEVLPYRSSDHFPMLVTFKWF